MLWQAASVSAACYICCGALFTLSYQFFRQDENGKGITDRPDDKGVYRSIPVRIMGAYKEPPQPYLVPVQMEQLIAGQKAEKQHPIEIAALFHLRFEGIHPFIDGTGRTGRLILNLMQCGYPPINVKFTDRHRYLDILK